MSGTSLGATIVDLVCTLDGRAPEIPEYTDAHSCHRGTQTVRRGGPRSGNVSLSPPTLPAEERREVGNSNYGGGFISQSTFRTTELGGPCDAVVKLPTFRGYPMELRSSDLQLVFARQPLEAGTGQANCVCNTTSPPPPLGRSPFPFSVTIFCPRICTSNQKNQGHSPGRPRQVPKLAGDWTHTHKAPPPPLCGTGLFS